MIIHLNISRATNKSMPDLIRHPGGGKSLSISLFQRETLEKEAGYQASAGMVVSPFSN
jgi:hypothetical protein